MGLKKSLFVYTAVGIMLGVLATVGYQRSMQTAEASCLSQYPFTSQSISCSDYEESSEQMKQLADKLEQVSAKIVNEGKAKRLSVWVRDLETRQWAGVNHLQQYIPASLLKVPLMIAYYKIAELDSAVLEETIQFTSATTDNNGEVFRPADFLKKGEYYTVDDLIRRMIVDSDNDAMNLLIDHVKEDLFQSTLLDLGVVIPSPEGPIDFVTPKSNANIYRILYNTSYVRRDFSEKALQLLSEVTFEGINAPLPASIKVSHKFGEREISDMNGSVILRQLHDCGIVYASKNTYSLCIMTEGKEYTELQKIIQEISQLVYKSFD